MKKNQRSRPTPRIKFYADENIDPALISALRRFQKVNIVSAIEFGFSGRDDLFHFQEARKLGRFLLTSDKDFLDNRRFPLRQTLGVVILAPPRERLDVGYFSLWLTDEIVPSGVHIEHTKIVIYRDHLDILYLDPRGKVAKDRIPHTDS